LFSVVSFANNTDLKYNAADVNTQFSAIDKLEMAVAADQNITVADVKNLAENLDLEPTTFAPVKDLPGGIPAFWWGFCLTWVGLLVVYIMTDNDKDQVKSAFKGCLISSLIIAAVYIIAYAGIFAAAASI
jgi:hypothetical protein